MFSPRRLPNCSGWTVRAGRRVEMRYNSMSIRDKDYPARPAPGVSRILMIGGSLVDGVGLAEKDIPARKLEGELTRRGLRVEVINAAGEGYSSWQNAVQLRGLATAYSPHVVVYHLASHYIFTDRSAWSNLRIKDGKITGRKSRTWLEDSLAAGQGWKEPFLFAYYAYRDQWNRLRASWAVTRHPDAAAQIEDLIAPTIEELRQMQEYSRMRGARFLVAYGAESVNADQYFVMRGKPPWIVRLSQRFWVRAFHFEGELIARVLRERGFEVLPLDAEMRELSRPNLQLAGDYHWNEEGSAVFAKALARELTKAWTPNPSAPRRPRPQARRAFCGDDVCSPGEPSICRADCEVNTDWTPAEGRLETLRHRGADRTYSVHVPACYDGRKRVPLVVVFHARGENSSMVEAQSGGLNQKADSACFIAAYPNAVDGGGASGPFQRWRLEPFYGWEETDDVGFVSAMLDRLESRYKIERSRVYVVGRAAGSSMAYAAACRLQGRIAAVGVVGGGLRPEMPCLPSTAVSILHLHGRADPEWPYLGGASCWSLGQAPVEDTARRWASLNGCSLEPSERAEREGVRCRTWGSCRDGAAVEQCLLDGHGSGWPGGRLTPAQERWRWADGCALGRGAGSGPLRADVSGVDLIWSFFERLRRSER